MRESLLLIILFYYPFYAAAKITLPADSSARISRNIHFTDDYNTWDVGAHMGLTFPRTDISGNGAGFGIGADITKFFSHSLGLQARLMHASFDGEDINRPEYRYSTTVHLDFTINAVIQIGNVSFLRQMPGLAFYGTAGIGLVHYSPEVSVDGNATKLTGIYSQYDDPYQVMDYQNRTDFMLPFGLGVKYRYNEKISFTGEYSYRTTNTDKLDGFFKLLSADDSYSYFNLGVTWHLGNKKKMIEWENPVYDLYSSLDSMNSKLENLTRDSDGDGVSDYFDKEPNTKPGTKVYGDGTPVISAQAPANTAVGHVPSEPARIKETPPDTTIIVKTPPVPETAAPAAPSVSKEAPANAPSEIKSPPAPVPPAAVPVNPQPEKAKAKTKDGDNNEVVLSVYFDYDDSKIERRYFKDLTDIAMFMKDNSSLSYRIVGICDGKAGNNQYNIKLGKRRAEAVKNHLVTNYRIKPERLKVETIVVPSPENMPNPANRRVDVIVVQ